MSKTFALEDGNLETRSIIGSRNIDYIDIDLSFETNSIFDVFKKRDAAAVKQSVKNVILTNKGEKPFRPKFGSSVAELLFELNDPTLGIDIRQRIIEAIQFFEPRALVQNVKVVNAIDENNIIVEIVFQVVNTEEIVNLNVTLSRLR